MSKFLYPIMRLPETNEEGIDKNVNDRKLPLYLKWWLENRSKQVLSEILTGSNLTLPNSAKNRKFKKFIVNGATEQAQYEGKNLFSGNYSQFNNTGGEGSTYAYFKLPDDNKNYTLTLIAKNNFTPTDTNFIGFCQKGGTATGVGDTLWAISGTGSGTIEKGAVISRTTYTNSFRFLSIYPKNQETLQTFVDNFYIQLEEGSSFSSYEPYVRRNT